MDKSINSDSTSITETFVRDKNSKCEGCIETLGILVTDRYESFVTEKSQREIVADSSLLWIDLDYKLVG